MRVLFRLERTVMAMEYKKKMISDYFRLLICGFQQIIGINKTDRWVWSLHKRILSSVNRNRGHECCEKASTGQIAKTESFGHNVNNF